MFLRMIRQSFFQGRRRKLLAAVTVALAAALITTLLALSIDVGDKMAREMKSYGSNIRVVPRSENIDLSIGGVDVNPLKGHDLLTEDDLPLLKDIFWSNNIVGFSPFLSVPVMLEGAENPLPLTGTYFDKSVPLPSDEDYRTGTRLTHPFWEVEGAWPDDGSLDQALVGAALAEAHGISIGDRITIGLTQEGQTRGADLMITGIVTTGESEDDGLIAPMAMVQELSGLTGKVASVSVSALTIPENELSQKAQRDSDALSTVEYDEWYCSAFVSSIAHQIEEAIPNTAALPIWQVASGEGAVIGKLQVLMLVITVAAFVSAAMGVSTLISTSVMERAREIGLMKALGGAIWQIVALFLAEAVIIGLIGGLVGYVAGIALSQMVGMTIFGSWLGIEWIALPVVLLISVLMALMGTILPARTVSNLMPVEVLYAR